MKAPLFQLLGPDGLLTCDQGHPDVPDPATACGLYRDMALVRRFDQEGLALQRQGELGLWIPLAGQEAAQVGSGRAAAETDMVFPSYREHGVAWCRGVDPLRLLGMFRGISNGGWDPAEHNFHLYTVVVGAQVLHAVGYAMGIQRDQAQEAVLVYFGDGASSQGDVNEAFVWAAAHNAPVVFFCQNNQWAISEPTSRQSRVPLYRRADGFGFPGVRVDGNDVFACLAVTRKALAAARAGQGPTLIEAHTYRMGPHTSSDDPTRYRSEAEVDEWRARDPLTRLAAYLRAGGHADEEFFISLEREEKLLADRVRSGCRELPDPAPNGLFQHVYAENHPLLADEQRKYAEYLASFVEPLD